MKNAYFFLCLLFVGVSVAQNQTFYVKPYYTDNRYTMAQDSHYVVRNTSVHRDKMLLFIGGSGSTPHGYALICQYAATLGFDVVSISYPNEVAAVTVTTSSDSLAFNKFRQEICFGTPQSDIVQVDTLNSIVVRTQKLLVYLSAKYPQLPWNKYLLPDQSPNWSNIVVAGHSQGAGHACFLGKHFDMDRVVMFSGPNDYSTFFSRSANWISKQGKTPIEKHFSLLHLQDEAAPFRLQLVVQQGLGMTQKHDTTNIDHTAPDYEQAQCLYTNLTPVVAGQYHSAPVGSHPSLPAVWSYMFTKNISTKSAHNNFFDQKLLIFPNPANNVVQVTIPVSSLPCTITIFDQLGKVVKQQTTDFQNTTIDVATLQQGLYTINANQLVGLFFKQ